jgi:hypothetical protein
MKNKKDLRHILEQVRKKGRNGDNVLAHINPLEAALLKKAGGSGTKNPKTGLPEFFFKGVRNFFKNPGKTISKTAKNPMRTIADAIGLGTAIFGGPLGGALGGAARSVIRGDKENPLFGALKGGMYGTALPMAGNLAGQGLSSMGATGIGGSLQNYGTSNMGSWMGNMGQLGGGVRGLGLPFTGTTASSGASTAGGAAQASGMGGTSKALLAGGLGANLAGGGKQQMVQQPEQIEGVSAGDESYFDKLSRNTKNYFSTPEGLMTGGVVGMQLYDRINAPKPLTPAQKGRAKKEEMLAQRLSPEELASQEAYELALEKGKRRNARNKFLPEERIQIDPLYTRVSTPEEYERSKRWLNYSNQQNQPVRF